MRRIVRGISRVLRGEKPESEGAPPAAGPNAAEKHEGAQSKL
jgi:hypothetical protein